MRVGGERHQLGRVLWRAFTREQTMHHIIRRPHLAGSILLVGLMLAVALGPVMPWSSRADAERVLERAVITVAATPSEPEPTTTVPPTTTIPPTTTTTAPPPPPTTVPAHRFTLEPYRGLGAWLDVYDWSATYAAYSPAVEADAIDQLAAQGVQTLFIQASKWDAPEDVVDKPRLLGFIDRAHQHGISVVAWYLPTLEDPGRDLQRLLAIAALPIEGLAVDIEARNVGDIAERNRRLIEVSAALRAGLPGEVIGAIPLEPVLMEDVNPNYWPGFPWAEIAPSYDVWLPMGYWTNRRGNSPWRDAYQHRPRASPHRAARCAGPRPRRDRRRHHGPGPPGVPSGCARTRCHWRQHLRLPHHRRATLARAVALPSAPPIALRAQRHVIDKHGGRPPDTFVRCSTSPQQR